MVQKNILPTVQPAKHPPSPTQVLHIKYLVTLLGPDEEDPDDPYYAGDIYKEKLTEEAKKWRAETHGKYLDRIRKSATAFPDLAHLASWMEVSTTVSRYKYLARNLPERKERAERVKVSQIDFKDGTMLKVTPYNGPVELAEGLAKGAKTEDSIDARVYVIEDLSRTVIEAFGTQFDLDPHFFRAHINDYMWNTPTGDAVELKHLDVLSRQQSHFRVSYLRPRYYRDTASFEKATIQAGKFNVLRQLDSDRSRESSMNDAGAVATLMRAKASIWTRKKDGDRCAVAILLVDPTLASDKEGYPIWGGYSSFAQWTPDGADNTDPKPPRTSLYDDVVYWTTRLQNDDIKDMTTKPKTGAIPLLWLILSDYQHVVQYITAQLGQIEWEIAEPSMRSDPRVDSTMKKLHPFRRNITHYRAMTAHAIDRIFAKEMKAKAESHDNTRGLVSLYRDFQIILDEIDGVQRRIERIVSVATALQSIEESRRAMEQNRNVARLTYLATVFIPLSFVSGFLSMVPDVSKITQTIWIFFTIAVPLTAVALLVADFLKLRTKLEKALGWNEREGTKDRKKKKKKKS